MGMDVYGKEATADEGRYFRNSAWWWRPLASYCHTVAPDITAKCKHWQSNDGDGLGADDARALADVLQAEIDSGRTLIYEKKYMGDLEMTPDETCPHCNGTGVRNDVFVRGTCNACEGKGSRRPPATWYPFNVENVQAFVKFLRACGGFAIN